MKNKLRLKYAMFKTPFAFSILLSFFLTIFNHHSFATPPSRIAILPFHIYADEELTFLQKGIEDMLYAKLATQTLLPVNKHNVYQRITPNGQPDKAQAITIGKTLTADYLLWGSVTVFGKSVSTQAELIRLSDSKSILVYSNTGDNRGKALQHVDQLAQKILTDVFHFNTAPPTQRPASAAPSIWKSKPIDYQAKSMAIADVNGDGNKEIVLATDKALYIYRFTGDSLSLLQKADQQKGHYLLRIDAADINGNRKAEIFVTRLNRNGGGLRSIVYELTSNKLKPITTLSSEYYSVKSSPNTPAVLVGQKKGFDSQIFRGNMYILKWKNGNYASTEPLKCPASLTIFGTNWGTCLNDGRKTFVRFNPFDRIDVLLENGENVWSSTEKFGGNTSYITYDSENDINETARYYLPQRIRIADMDGNGTNEIWLVKNKDIAGRTFSRFRSYSNGTLHSLEWRTIGFKETFKTQEVPGYISDFDISDITNSGRNALIFCTISKKGKIFSKKKSFLVIRYL